MKTVVHGEHEEMTRLLERRRAAGQDRFDEVWSGEPHLAAAKHSDHGLVVSGLMSALAARARAAGLTGTSTFALGAPDDFRVPDGGYWREPSDAAHAPTAAVVVEVLSPDDETFEKFAFYAAHGVDELIVADPDAHTVRCWHLTDGQYVEQPASALLDVDMASVGAEVDWP